MPSKPATEHLARDVEPGPGQLVDDGQGHQVADRDDRGRGGALAQHEAGAGHRAGDAVGPGGDEGHLGVAQTLGESAEPFGGVGPADLPVLVHQVGDARRTHPLAVRVDVLEVHHDDHVAMAELGQVGTEGATGGETRRW